MREEEENMSWQSKAKKMARGKWVRFDANEPIHTILFTGEPQIVEKTSTIGNRKGEKYEQLSFPVEEDGEDRILEPNMSLLRLLLEEEEEEPIVGRKFKIKCLDVQNKREWKITEVAGDGIKQSWAGEKKIITEEKPLEKEEENTLVTKNEEKDKFMMQVKKRTKKLKAEEKKQTEGWEENEENARNDPQGEATSGEME